MKQRTTRFLSLLLALVMVLGLVPVVAIPQADAEDKPLYAYLREVIPGLAYPIATRVTSMFTFTGTGFDLITRTGSQQGTFRVEVYRDEDRTKAVKTMTVNTKGELELYQIPTVSVHDLDHGKYYVSIMVNEEITTAPFEMLRRGNQLYLDAIRIYDPIDVSKGTASTDQEALSAYAAYCGDREAYPVIKEVREILLTAPQFNSLNSSMPGAVYVDYSEVPKETVPATDAQGNLTGGYVPVPDPAPDLENHIITTIATYEKIGPKNEVYLNNGQMIAFRLDVYSKELPKRLDVGCKNIDGTGAQLSVLVARDATAQFQPKILPVYSNTAQYYTVPLWNAGFTKTTDKAGREIQSIYVVIQNQKAGVLSVTDIKIAYDGVPTLPDSTEAAAYSGGLQKRNGAVELPIDSFVEFTVDGEVSKVIDSWVDSAWSTSSGDGTPPDGDGFVTEPETGIIAEGIKLRHSLNLASDISINFAVEKSLLQGFDMETVYVLAELDTYEGDIKTGVKTIKILPEEQNEYYYYFALKGLTAVNMNDKIRSVLYGTKDGQVYYSPVDEYSIATYAYSQLDKTSVSESLKTLCADLLRYGANAQIFKSYRTDSLADAAMTEVHKAYLSDMEAVAFGNHNLTLNDLPNPTITWVGKTLNLESKVTLKFVFSTANYTGNLKDLSLRISYTNIEGKTITATADEVEAYNGANGQYAFSFDGLLAAELRTVVSAQIYEGNTPVSSTLHYSADTYGNNKTGTLGTLCKTLFAYSDSALAYFK